VPRALPAVKIGFIAAVLLEIAVFILVGQQIGVLATLALIILSAAYGLALLRGETRHFFAMLADAAQSGRLEAQPESRRLISCFAAVLLILPGLIGSCLGLILLIPPLQKALIAWAARAGIFKNAVCESEVIYDTDEPAGEGKGESPILDLEPGEYHARDPENSPWRKP